MGIHDRDWYRDAIQRREAREEQHKPEDRKPASPPMHWTLHLMTWAAAVLIAYVLEKKVLWPIVERLLTH